MRIKMLGYNRIDISEGIDVRKANLLRKCDICHYWYFKDIGFKYEKYLWNGCHDLIQKATSFDNVVIVYVKKKILTELIFGIWLKMVQLT